VRVWDIETSRAVAVLPVELENNPYAGISRTTLMAASGTRVKFVPIFDSVEQTIEFAIAKAPRQLTRQERLEFSLLNIDSETCAQ
jgi:hypothetical protein